MSDNVIVNYNYSKQYTELQNIGPHREYEKIENCTDLKDFALHFIFDSCKGLRFDHEDKKYERKTGKYSGKSMGENQIPYNMEKDIDRLCLERALERFLNSGKKEDAFDVYFCYLEMFIGGYAKTRRMIELLSEYEANGSSLLMKHRDHYSHSVYVFALGLAIYESNEKYRKAYKDRYGLKDDEQKTAHHFLEYWGLTSLFHDIGYPFELPFEQVEAYFGAGNPKERVGKPFMAYNEAGIKNWIQLSTDVKSKLREVYKTDRDFKTTNELFAFALKERLGNNYAVTKEKLEEVLEEKPVHPEKYTYYMDHAYFSATVLFKKLFEELDDYKEINKEHIDAMTAILMHNSLYKFKIANDDPNKNYKDEGNHPFDVTLHPLAYLLMLCDELQCWDRTAYGRNSKKELHPMGCTFDFSNNSIKATYLYDEKEIGKINKLKDECVNWLYRKPNGDKDKEDGWKKAKPKLKAYSDMYIKYIIKNEKGKEREISTFQEDIEKIVDLTEIKLQVEVGLAQIKKSERQHNLSESNFLNLYNFAMILNGRWNCQNDWKKARDNGQEEEFVSDEKRKDEFTEAFDKLSLEYKLSNINQAKAFDRYLNMIGAFYTDKPVGFELFEGFTNEELAQIGIVEHKRWLQEHIDMGWVDGNPETKQERELERCHKDMVIGYQFKDQRYVSDDQVRENYKRLDKEEQDKDTEPMECMLAMLRVYDGLRFYRLN